MSSRKEGWSWIVIDCYCEETREDSDWRLQRIRSVYRFLWRSIGWSHEYPEIIRSITKLIKGNNTHDYLWLASWPQHDVHARDSVLSQFILNWIVTIACNCNLFRISFNHFTKPFETWEIKSSCMNVQHAFCGQKGIWVKIFWFNAFSHQMNDQMERKNRYSTTIY